MRDPILLLCCCAWMLVTGTPVGLPAEAGSHTLDFGTTRLYPSPDSRGFRRQAEGPRSVSAYRTIVDDYRRYGSSAVTAIVAFTGAEIDSAIDSALASAGPGAWTWEELRGAVMLHTEAVVDRLQSSQSAGARIHLGAAVRLLDAVVRRAVDQTEYSYRWHTTLIPLLKEHHAPTFADTILTRMKERFRQSPALIPFLEGLEFELRGCREGVELSAQSGFGVDSTGSAPLPSRWLVPAARKYEAALTADKTFMKAALHLGRLRMLERKLDEALRLLESATPAADSRVRYLALLFSGSILERQGRYADAERRYRDALASYRWGQSGQFALAQVLSRTGREAEGRSILLERFGRRERIAEPLWSYFSFRADDDVDILFDELRVEVER
jgi:tetratricopeptide (TPR) repeat protein